MDGRPLSPGQIKQALDACRAGSADLGSPELREVARRVAADPQLAASFGRMQGLDQILANALSDVAVPEGLDTRLQALLKESPAAAEGASQNARSSGRVRALKLRLPRRRVLWAAAAAALVLAAGTFYVRRSAVSVDEIVNAARSEELANSNWRSIKSAPKYLGLPRRFARAVSWQPAKLSGVTGAAYNFSSSPRQRAVLYVLPRTIAGLPSSPPKWPQSQTGGQLIGAWESGGLVYVLVVSGPASGPRYRNLVATPTSPLA